MKTKNAETAKDEQKRTLWRTIRDGHPMLAERLVRASTNEDGFVSIDGYPTATRQWLWSAIETHNPELADQLAVLGAAKKTFTGSTVSLRVDDLVNVLIAGNG